MTNQWRCMAGGAGGIALVSALLLAGTAGTAAAAPASGGAGVSFSRASLHAYASGELVHIGALKVTGSDPAVDSEAGYATSSANSDGLAKPIVGDQTDGALTIQPAQSSSIKAYGAGAGLALGLDSSTPAKNLTPDLAERTAPANAKAVTKVALPTSVGNPGYSGGANALIGQAAADYEGRSCPIGRPLSYGDGETSGVDLIKAANLPGETSFASGITTALAPLTTLLDTLGLRSLPTAGYSTNPYLAESNGETQTLSQTFLSPDGSGQWGVSSFESVEPAPLRVNLLGLVQVKVALLNKIADPGQIPDPLRLVATATGKGTGAKVSLQDNDIVEVSADVLGQTIDLIPPTPLNTIGSGGKSIPLSLGGATGILATALKQIPGAGPSLRALLALVPSSSQLGSLGTLEINPTVRAVGGSATSKPTTTRGISASGAFDLLHLDLAPTVDGMTTNLANVALDHLEVSAHLAEAIDCTTPVAVTSGATTLKTGRSTNLTVKAGGPSMAALQACYVGNVNVSERLTSATTAFRVTGAAHGGSIRRTGARSATVTWSGRRMSRSPSGPLTLADQVVVPTSARAGTIDASVSVSGRFAGCVNAAAFNDYKFVANGQVESGTADRTVRVIRT